MSLSGRGRLATFCCLLLYASVLPGCLPSGDEEGGEGGARAPVGADSAAVACEVPLSQLLLAYPGLSYAGLLGMLDSAATFLEAPGGSVGDTGRWNVVILWRPGQELDCVVCFDVLVELELLRRRLPEGSLGFRVYVPRGAGTTAREALDVEEIPWSVRETEWSLLTSCGVPEVSPLVILCDEAFRQCAAW
jgi:hypothetical protein